MRNDKKRLVPTTNNQGPISAKEMIGSEEEYLLLYDRKEHDPAVLAILKKPLIAPSIVYIIDLPSQGYKHTFKVDFSLFGFRIIDEEDGRVLAYNVYTKNIATDCGYIDAEFLRGMAAIVFTHLESKIDKRVFIYDIIHSPRFNEYLHSCLVYIATWRVENGFIPQ